jgi:hypothetical protein
MLFILLFDYFVLLEIRASSMQVYARLPFADSERWSHPKEISVVT